jgi:oligo-1,6-glucosidase
MFLGHGPLGKFDPVPYTWDDIKRIFVEWDEAMGQSGWISIFLDNHDFPRLVSRFGNDKKYRIESAKMLAMMVLTLRGTPCIYQGSELAMTNVHFPKLEDYKDVETLNFYKEFSARGMSKKDFLKQVHQHGRDNVRTPMHWDNSQHAGFTSGITWIALNPNYKDINVEAVLADPDSVFYFYKNLLAYRKEHLTLVYGSFNIIPQKSKDIFVYERTDGHHRYYILLNHSNRRQNYKLDLGGFHLEISNLADGKDGVLRPWEGRIYRKV